MIPHTAIPVTEITRAVSFYERLGFILGKHWDRPEWKMKGCFLSHPSGFNIELIYHPDNITIKRLSTPEVLHVAIPTTDLKAMIDILSKEGVQIIRPISPGITVKQLAFIKDPDGFTIELFEKK